MRGKEFLFFFYKELQSLTHISQNYNFTVASNGCQTRKNSSSSSFPVYFILGSLSCGVDKFLLCPLTRMVLQSLISTSAMTEMPGISSCDNLLPIGNG